MKVVRSEEYQIKEYSLGTEVFLRKESFDPRSDTIVRVQVHRLRTKLEGYYKTEGTHDPIRFEIPKGSYVPVIIHREPIDLPCKAASSKSPAARCRIAVLPFSNLSEDGSNENLADAITETLIDDLTQVGGLDVISRTSAYTFKQQYKDARVIGRHLNIDAILEGSVQRSAEVVRIRARLVNTRTGFTLWTATFDSKSKDLLAVQKQTSEGIVPNIVSLLRPLHSGRRSLREVQH
jgi:TolB-like protein